MYSVNRDHTNIKSVLHVVFWELKICRPILFRFCTDNQSFFQAQVSSLQVSVSLINITHISKYVNYRVLKLNKLIHVNTMFGDGHNNS